MTKSKTAAPRVQQVTFANEIYLPLANGDGKPGAHARKGYVLFKVDRGLLGRIQWAFDSAFPDRLDGAIFHLPRFTEFYRGTVKGMPREAVMRVDESFVAEYRKPLSVTSTFLRLAYHGSYLYLTIEGHVQYGKGIHCRHVQSVPFSLEHIRVPGLIAPAPTKRH